MEMTLSEALGRLKDEGLTIKPWQVHHAIRSGYVSRPRMTASNRYHFGDQIIEEMIRYFRKPRRPGRKPKGYDLEKIFDPDTYDPPVVLPSDGEKTLTSEQEGCYMFTKYNSEAEATAPICLDLRPHDSGGELVLVDNKGSKEPGGTVLTMHNDGHVLIRRSTEWHPSLAKDGKGYPAVRWEGDN